MSQATAGHRVFLPMLLAVKGRLLRNHLSDFRRHMWIHVAMGAFALSMLVGGGTILFSKIFEYLNNLEVFGPLLVDHLVKMVLLAFFSMLIFSNLIIMLTTTYLSREVEYLMSQPIDHRQLYFGKLGESILYSSWAFLLISCPLFIAIARTHHLGLGFFVGSAVLLVPFVVLPAAMGAFVALVVTVWFPPRQIFRFAQAMLAIGVIGALVAHRMYGLDHLLGIGSGRQGGDDLGQMMRVLSLGDLLLLPSGWLGRGLTALQYGDAREAAFWALVLWSTAALAVVVLDALAGPLYFRGWCSVRSSGTTQRRRSGGFYGAFDRALGFLPRPTRALVAKDLTVFWRDPAQWSQLLILFGLLFIYIANLRSAAGMAKLEAVFPGWRTLLSMFNIGATTFVLSILTTRFVFPMLSLEGKQQWVIGLAPVGRTRLVWVKFMVSWLSATALTLPLAVLSSAMLQTELPITLLSVGLVAVMAVGLSALAVGLGALMPSFNDDNPARIASGFGGTINAVLSLSYIGLSLAMVTPWVQAYIAGHPPAHGIFRWIFFGSFVVWGAIQVGAIVVPMWLGLKRWGRMEF